MARKSKKNKPLPEDEPPLAEPGEPLAAEAVGRGDADLPETIPGGAEEEKPGEPPPEGKEPAAPGEEPAPLEEADAIPDITKPDNADDTRTPKEDEEPGPDMPPYEPAPLAREPLVKPGTLLLLALVIGGGGLLFYQNLEMARSTAELKESLAKIENRLESLASEKMDEKSGVMIAQAVKTLKEDVRILKEREEQPATRPVAAESQSLSTPPEPEPTADAPESEIAVDPRLLEGEPEGEGESEEQAEAEEARQVAAVTPPAGEEKEVPAEEPVSDVAGEEPEAAKAPPEVAEAAPEPEGAEAEAPEEEAGDEEPEAAQAQPEEADEEEPEVVEAPPAEAPAVEQAERTPVVRDYLNFIEDSARKFSQLLQSGLDRFREVFSG